MMTKEQYLLCKLAEEASEVAKAALKAQQFGLSEVYPQTGKRNSERLAEELNDLRAVVGLLVGGGVNLYTDVGAITEKEEKIEKYMNYSQRLGLVEW